MSKSIGYGASKLLSMIGLLLLCGCSNNLNKTEIKLQATPETKIQQEVQEQEVKTEEDNMAFRVIKEMKVGWNLGNTFDGCDFKKIGIQSSIQDKTPEEYYETLWHNPITTKKMIDAVAKEGFGAVRIPVTYYDHMDENFQIRKEWLDRVEEVVDYVLDNDMYCIINLHHEEAWLTADIENLEENKKHLETVWTQIAERFENYDDKLLFEGFNEIQDKEKHWSDAESSTYEAVNVLNQAFVDTVRKSAGYNKERYLIVNTYAAAADDATLGQFCLPEDSIENHLIVQIHTYAPLEFSWTEKQVTWTSVRDNWDETEDTAEIDTIIQRLHKRFIDQDTPVIIGEFGAWNKNNTAERVKYAEYVVSTAKKNNITCFWWDMGGIYQSEEDINTSVLLKREDSTWYFPEIAEALVKAAE